ILVTCLLRRFPMSCTHGSYLVRFQRGTIRARIHLDGQGRIDGLLFTNPQFTYVSRSAALQGLRRLPGQVSLLVLTNGAPRLTIDPDRALAVGSAFKLAVLAALQQRIKAGQLSWKQEVTAHSGYHAAASRRRAGRAAV